MTTKKICLTGYLCSKKNCSRNAIAKIDGAIIYVCDIHLKNYDESRIVERYD